MLQWAHNRLPVSWHTTGLPLQLCREPWLADGTTWTETQCHATSNNTCAAGSHLVRDFVTEHTSPAGVHGALPSSRTLAPASCWLTTLPCAHIYTERRVHMTLRLLLFHDQRCFKICNPQRRGVKCASRAVKLDAFKSGASGARSRRRNKLQFPKQSRKKSAKLHTDQRALASTVATGSTALL